MLFDAIEDLKYSKTTYLVLPLLKKENLGVIVF